MKVKTPKEIARRDMNRLLGQLNDEAFTWLALAMLPPGEQGVIRSRPQIWPDGLGGFIDREKLEELRLAAQRYVDAQK